MVAQDSPSLTMAVVHCVMAFRVSPSLVSFFLPYHSSPLSPRQATHGQHILSARESLSYAEIQFRSLKSDLTILEVSTSELVVTIFCESKLPVCIKFIIKCISSISTVPQKDQVYSVKLVISGFTALSKSHTSLVQLKEKQKLRKY